MNGEGRFCLIAIIQGMTGSIVSKKYVSISSLVRKKILKFKELRGKLLTDLPQ
jgi:hypothetical protein